MVWQGKCQVIRCLSEGGREEPTSPRPDPEQSLVLSEEIIELLSSASKTRELPAYSVCCQFGFRNALLCYLLLVVVTVLV